MDIEKELEKQWKHVNVYGSVAIFNNMKLIIQEIVKEYEEQLNFANSELIELRAYKEAAEIQVPFAWANNQGETTINEIQVEYWERGGYKIIPLYAKPAVAVPDSIIFYIDFALDVIYNETIMQVCCGRLGQECCGSPDADWPLWATEAMTKLSSARNLLLAAAPPHSQHSHESEQGGAV